MKKLNIDKDAQKELDRIDAVTRRRIIKGITGLLQEPPLGDIKPLHGYSDGRHRIRIGKYRVIFYYSDENLNIIDIGSRGDIYK